ncbi:acyl-CoA dehydrogenase family protein [Paraglaciecola polaris]|uniref:Acyl-CoA dehydrogenase n=1 Tax=Paraglaciecola polaris LMG 21857 TaxID=1129793 RepID=K6Z9Z2_9ALTE|nr:acyl-CoA dehydrogenase family protein [Paraglaciecola polaris]GAC32946.1 acyl-CoA dehydrogenase [Paraglaciecola polaris LMG 21857]|tara:strand:- start:7217 stop:8356 length:1140 start_codon:yes stop_codon:yes gene_type:complete
MNFNLSEEQNMLKDSVARFVQDEYDFESRRANAASELGFNPKNWQTFAELGWLSIPFDEAHGGFGGGATDVMAVMEEMGKGLVVEPFVATVLMFGGLLNKSANAALQDTYIEKIIDGSLQGAFAYLERQSRFELADVKTQAKRDGNDFVLKGEKTVVFNGAAANKVVVSARTSGEQCDEAGITLFLIDTDAAGVERTPYRLMDGQLVANIKLNDVRVAADHVLGDVDNGYPIMDAVVGEVIIALSAEAMGIMQKLNTTTIEYTKTRQQFGVAISSFQALQHRMVDMFMAGEQAKSILYRAVCAAESGADDLAKNIAALKVMIGRNGKLIGDEAIQLHGGMGLTDELDVGHYVKRLMMINTTFGDADYQQQKFNRLAYTD